MKAVVLRDGHQVTLEERPEPEPGPNDVLIRTHHCGICGTDLHAPMLADLFVPNVIMGHEFAGEIVEVGREVRDWQPSDRVVVNPNGDVCRTCRECRQGRPNLCQTTIRGKALGVHLDGGMAEYVSVPSTVLHRLPDGVSSLQGAWSEPLAVALRVVRVADFRVGASALVLGAGPIGLLVLQVLRRAGASSVAVVEPSDVRRQMARGLGADVTVDPTSEDLLDIFDGEVPAPEFVFECAGIPGGVATAASVVRPAGTVAVVGISPERLDLNVDDLIFKEVTIRGSIIYVEEFPMAVRMLEQRAVDVEAMTSQVMPLESYDTAFHLLGQTESAVKILLRP